MGIWKETHKRIVMGGRHLRGPEREDFKALMEIGKA